VQHPHAAGIDIGSRSHWVCVGFATAADSCLIQEFPAHTAGLKAIAAFLREHQVNTVALESTGIYWIPLFELKLAYEAWQFTLGQVEKVDAQIGLQLGRMKSDRALPPLKPKVRPKRRANSPGFDVRTALYYVVGLDLTEIEGVSALTALTIISEIGPGVSQFATVKKFCSWLGLCPNWKKTGGRVKSSRTRRGVNRAAQALRLAAQSLHHSKGAQGGFLRRMKGRPGVQAALTATAHKLARIVYLALKHGMTYVRQSQEEYESQMKERQIKALKRKARLLGLEVIEKTSGSDSMADAASAQG
jgi:transposase